MNGNVFKFDSKTTAQRTNDKRTADYFVAFVLKTQWFDNNNTQVYVVYIKNYIAFNNNINYQLPFFLLNRIIIGVLMIIKIIKIKWINHLKNQKN